MRPVKDGLNLFLSRVDTGVVVEVFDALVEV